MTLILNRSQPGKACLLLPYIILEFLQLVGFGACIVLTVGSSSFYIFSLFFLMWEKTKHCFGFCIYLTVGGTLLMIIVMIAILKTTIVIVNFN